MDCLETLRFGEPLPARFPPWLNIYDPGDLLSYRAKEVFQGDPRIQEHRYLSRDAFVEAHSAYWTSPQVWERIMQFLNRI
jgi:hypothetical protein